jgi:hypothetical protein
VDSIDPPNLEQAGGCEIIDVFQLQSHESLHKGLIGGGGYPRIRRKRSYRLLKRMETRKFKIAISK